MAKTKKAVGIDVSAATLHVAIEGRDQVMEFTNNPSGFEKLARVLRTARGRFVLEATGTYHLDLACFLHDRPHSEVMVVNPRTAKDFHRARSQRAKTDRVDARSLLEFGLRMPFVPWQRPTKEALEVRATARYIDQLIRDHTRLRNQLHACDATKTSPDWVATHLRDRISDLDEHITATKERLVTLVIKSGLSVELDMLVTIPGIARGTASQIIAEFAFLDPTMTSKQLTAWAGLDPRPNESGTSVRGRRPMSKKGNARIRRLLYMSSLSAARKGPLHAFKRRIQDRSGSKMVGLGAVMRKLLVIAWAVFRTRTAWDPLKASPRAESRAAA